MEQQLDYKDIVIKQLSFRVNDLESYVMNLLQQNEQLRKELSVATIEEVKEVAKEGEWRSL